MASKSSPMSVLRLRSVRLVIAARGVSVLGDRMVAVALAFAVLEIGGSPSAVGLVLAAGMAPILISVLVGGVVADRLPRRTLMVGSDLLRVLTQGATAALLLGHAAELWMLAALAALTGLGTGFFNPASTGLLPELVPAEELQAANALRGTISSAAEIAGPLVAGILVAAAGAGTAIAIDAATFAASAACLLAMRLPAHVPPPSASFMSELRDGWDAFRSRRWVWVVVLYFAVANMMYAAWASLGPIVAERSLGGAEAWGVVLAGIGVGTLVGSLIAVRIDPERPLIVLALSEGLFVLPLGLLALGGSVWPLLIAAVGSGVGATIGMSVWDSTLQRQIPAETISRVASYDWFGSFAFFPLGMALWGPLASWIGLSSALWLAFGLLVAMVAALLALPETRALRRSLTPVELAVDQAA